MREKRGGLAVLPLYAVQMSAAPKGSTAAEPEVLEAARAGDEDAFQRLVEPHRGELHAHCYRMLGSVHDAEDALQEALLRAWRGLGAVRGPQLAALLALQDRDQRLPRLDRPAPEARAPGRLRRAADPHDGPGEPLVESVWVEPYPDEALGLEDGFAAPEARYEQRESVELAFIAALQHLPATQRAVLILREVLGFSAREAAETLETTRRLGQQRPAARPRSGRGAAARAEPAGDAARRSATSGVARARRELPRRLGTRATSTPSSRC